MDSGYKFIMSLVLSMTIGMLTLGWVMAIFDKLPFEGYSGGEIFKYITPVAIVYVVVLLWRLINTETSAQLSIMLVTIYLDKRKWPQNAAFFLLIYGCFIPYSIVLFYYE